MTQVGHWSDIGGGSHEEATPLSQARSLLQALPWLWLASGNLPPESYHWMTLEGLLHEAGHVGWWAWLPSKGLVPTKFLLAHPETLGSRGIAIGFALGVA